MGGLISRGAGLSRVRALRFALVLAAALGILLSASSGATRPVSAFESSNSHLTIWGDNALAPRPSGGPVTATARLVDFSPERRGEPLSGRTITFSLGNQTRNAVTNAAGEASATFTYAPGQTDVIVALFAGDAGYGPSLDRGWLRGDIVVGVGRGMAHRYDSTGTFVNVFDSTTGSLETAGMCFDSGRNLYLVNFQARVISKFNRTTGEVTPAWAGGFNRSPESCVLGREDMDGDGVPEDVIYAGEQDGLNDIRKFNTDGELLGTFDVAVGNRGADWIDLGTGGTTVRYTSEGSEIFAFDLAANAQVPSFVPDQSVPANQLVPRPDSLPRNAIDGFPDTAWVTNDGAVSNQFITIDLAGNLQTINGVYIEGHSESTAVREFRIQVSTTGTADTDFTTVFTGASPRDTSGQAFSFPPVNAHFVRLLATGNHGSAIHLRVDELRIFNTSGVNVAAASAGASVAAASSIQRDPLLIKPCFALRNRPDGSALVTCAGEVALVSADGLTALRRYSRAALGFDSTDTIYGLNLGLDGESFWASSQVEGRIVHVDVESGAVLHSFGVQKRGPTVGGIAIFGEPTEGVNYEPAAHGQSVSTEMDTSLPVTLTGDDPESEPLTFTVVNQPDHGRLTGSSPNLTYTPDPGFTGEDYFTFLAFDGELFSAPATVTVTVTPPGGLMASAGGPYAVNEGSTLSLDASGTMGDAVTYEWDLDGDGVFGETGAAAANGDETGVVPVFSAAGIDGPAQLTASLRVTSAGGFISTAHADITVSNAAPVVSITGFEITADGTATLAGELTDLAATDTHTAIVDWGDGSLPEELGPVSGTFTATHSYPLSGIFTATVTVTDDDGGSGTAAATATVGEPGNQPPVALAQSVAVMRDGSVEITLTGIDPDLPPSARLTFSVAEEPVHGTLSAIFHGGATSALAIYRPGPGFTGQDSFTFRVSDGQAMGAPAAVTITVFAPSSGGGGGGGAIPPAPTSTPGGVSGPVASTPSEPLAVSAKPADRAVSLSWSPPANDGGAPVAGYRVLILNSAEVRFVLAPATSLNIAGLENGVSYSFQLQAFNSAGYGPSVIAGPVTPAGLASAPLDVTATVAGEREVLVTWSAPESDGGSPVLEYIIELTDGREVGRTDRNEALSALLGGLAPGSTYSFVVSALTAIGRGEPSEPSEPVLLPDLPSAPDDPTQEPDTSVLTPATALPSATPPAGATPAPQPTPEATRTAPLRVESTPFVMTQVERGGDTPWLVLGLAAAGMVTGTALAARLLVTGIPGMGKR